MTEKTGAIIEDALGELVVQTSEEELEASEIQVAIRYMNRFMFQLYANGISLGFTKVSNVADTVTIADGAMM